MKVAIVTTQVPFLYGGAEVLVDNLANAVIGHGHDCEVVRIPFKWYPPETILNHILASRVLDLSEVNGDPIDKIIALKFPSYYIPHDNKTVWLIHQHRQAYELWNTDYCDLIHYPDGREVRDAIRTADNRYLSESKSIYTISKNVTSRLDKYNNIKSVPLYHPPQYEHLFKSSGYDNYIFFPSRLSAMKRQELAIKSMRFVNSDVKLILAGKPDNETYLSDLNKLVTKYDLQDKVEILGGISTKEMMNYYSNAMAVLYPPYDEDYGYVTLEAMLSQKPVITCQDSGGPNEFIIHGMNGFVVPPDEVEIARCIESLAGSDGLVSRMGKASREHYQSLNISWTNVVEVLLK